MDKIKLGIIGFGNMGTGHTSNIMGGNCPEVELVAICDKNPDRCEFGKSKYPDANITYFTDAIEMLDSGLIDSCLVAVPHYDHAKYSMECMKRGIHVMCEKPAGVYTRQVREMIAESEKHPEVVFGMMFNQRTNPVYRKMHELVHSGKYGEIRRTNWLITNWYRSQAYYNSSDWRATWAGEGGGVLLNQCPHQLDLWQWICGMPEKITAVCKYSTLSTLTKNISQVESNINEGDIDYNNKFVYSYGETNTFIVNIIVFLIIYFILSQLDYIITTNIFTINLKSITCISLYHILKYIILLLANYNNYSIKLLGIILLRSLIMTIIYTTISYLIMNKIYDNKRIR